MVQNPPIWDRIAAELGETEPHQRLMIRRVVKTLGFEQVTALAEATQTCYRSGGMLTRDGTGQRTLGGIFYVLLKEQCTPEQRAQIFPSSKEKKTRWQAHQAAKAAARGETPADPPQPVAPAAPPAPTLPTFDWTARRTILAAALTAPGEARSMKVTLIGRPGRVILRQDVAMTMMTYTAPQTGFPKGVPAPPSAPQSCTVYIGAKQWAKVAEAIENPEDTLIIEGVAAYDPELEGLSIHATNITTKLLQQEKKTASTPEA